MDILVCMKLISVRRFADQIPSDSPAGRLKNGDLTANPADLTALEAALRLRDAEGSGRVTVMAMAPAAAEPVLRRCLAMGADAALHLCDMRFAGADTIATAGALRAAVELLPPQELILCGQKSLDSSTGHVGAQLAWMLGRPFLPDVLRLEKSGETLTMTCAADGAMAVIQAAPPLLLSLRASPELVRSPTILGLRRSLRAGIRRITAGELSFFPEGSSRTRTLMTAEHPFSPRGGRLLSDGPAAAEALAAILKGGSEP